MSWKDDFKKSFDRTYEIVRRKYPDIRFPCYGGRFYWFLITRHFESLYFYLTENSLIYTSSSAYITEIKFSDIKKISIKQGWLFKSSFRICKILLIYIQNTLGYVRCKLLCHGKQVCGKNQAAP